MALKSNNDDLFDGIQIPDEIVEEETHDVIIEQTSPEPDQKDASDSSKKDQETNTESKKNGSGDSSPKKSKSSSDPSSLEKESSSEKKKGRPKKNKEGETKRVTIVISMDTYKVLSMWAGINNRGNLTEFLSDVLDDYAKNPRNAKKYIDIATKSFSL